MPRSRKPQRGGAYQSDELTSLHGPPPNIILRQSSRPNSTLGIRRGRSKEVYLEGRPMSEVGQKTKYSYRAYVFRCSPGNGHRHRPQACLKLPLTEVARPHSMTLSASTMTLLGIVRPNEAAVL